MTEHRAVIFHRTSSPYVAGDVAGVPALQAQTLVDRGVASFYLPIEAAASTYESHGADEFRAMDRAQLIAYAAEHFGITDAPAADVTDDQLREALRSGVAPVTVPAPASKPGKGKA